MLKKLNDPTLDEKFVSGREAFSGRLLKVQIDKVVLPNGKETTRELIRHPGAVAIIPELEDGSIILVKQYRYPVASVLYELPAGKLDPGEDPLACAKRELSEETGYAAASWQYLTTIVTTPGFTDEVIHLYKASGLTKGAQHTDEDEFINLETVSPEGIKKMLKDGSLYDGKTLAALGYAAIIM